MTITSSAPKTGLKVTPRGPLSDAVIQSVQGNTPDEDPTLVARRAVNTATDLVHDDDVQLALYVLYASFYGAFAELPPHLEWDSHLIETRRILEEAFEHELRVTVEVPEAPAPRAAEVAKSLFALTSTDSGPSLSRFMAKQATEAQAREFLVQRSIYTLREADPHSWAIPRLRGRPKTALVEIQADEYGGGHPERMHATIFAKTMRGLGLDDTYGAYIDLVPAITLASHNIMSMFGLNRRLIGAIVGHLAAFEMTSSIPNRFYSDGFRRLGFGEDVTDYFDEHVEADAVHEQIAAHDMAGALAEDHPELLPDIMFGAAACLTVDGWMATHMHEAWTNTESSLREGASLD